MRASNSLDAERFDQIVVGTHLETDDAVEFTPLGCQHDNRDRAVRAQPPTQTQSIFTRHQDVEDDEIDLRRPEHLRH